jgi:hypothetical protein
MTLLRAFAVLLCGVLGGCATVNHMAFDKNATSVDVSSKSVVLMTIDVYRPDKSRFEPVPTVVNIEEPNAQSKEERENFVLDKKLDSVTTEDGHTLYLARMALKPGPYKLMALFGMARAFPINAIFQVPLVTDFNLQPGTVVYMGRVTATLRPRQGDEFRAGPVIPLIDQAVAGMSGGTWDVSMDDRYDADLALFRQGFKAVESASVVKSPLPAFNRAAAQRWWEDHSTKDKGKPDDAAAAATTASADVKR